MAYRDTALVCVLLGSLLLGLQSTAWAGQPARIDQVQNDPFYSAWYDALEKRQTIVAQIAASGLHGDECGADVSLQQAALQVHRTRMQLLESLQHRGLSPTPPPTGVAPWPWSAAAGKTPTVSHFDQDNVSVLVDDGIMVFINLNARLEVDGALAARVFYESHDDEYDFLVLFTDFYSELFNGRFRAYHLAVSNDIPGLGYQNTRLGDNFNERPAYTKRVEETGALRSFLHLNDIRLYPDNPDDTYIRSYSGVAFMLHEFSHRWGTRLRLWTPLFGPQNLLLGRGDVHWSFFSNAGASFNDGLHWVAENDGFRTAQATASFGPLDLYLMGLMHPNEIDAGELFYLQDPHDLQPPLDVFGREWNVASPPQADVFCRATRVDFDMDGIFLGNGVRRPLYPDAPSTFRAATVMVIPAEGSSFVSEEIAKINVYQQRLAEVFQQETLQRGTLDMTLTSIPAQLSLIHLPQGDLEQADSPVEIAVKVDMLQRSLPTTLDEVNVTLHYRINEAAEVALAMQRGIDDVFRATIPGQALGARIDYWLQADSGFPEYQFTLPESAPAATISYEIIPDSAAPTIQHIPVDHHARAAEPVFIRALVRDTHAVAAVYFEYRLAPGNWQRHPLQRQGVSDVFEKRFVLPGRFGSEIEYRIVAEDAAATPHISTAPNNGFHLLQITESQQEDVETEDPLWSHRSLKKDGIDQWHHERHNRTLGGLYCWKVGPENVSDNPRAGRMELDTDAVLESPALRLTADWSLTFFHKYYLRLSPPDTDFDGLDGALVEWQDIESPQDVLDDRWYPIEPVAGYPKTLGTYALYNPLRGSDVWAGRNDYWRPETFDRTGTFRNLGNRLIRFRFRCAVSPIIWYDLPGPGWYIDDISINPGPGPTAVALEDVRAVRQAQEVQLSWTARDVQPGEGFHVYRATAANPPEWQRLAEIAAVVGVEHYSFRDPEVRIDDNIHYRLTLVRDGVEIVGHVVELQALPLRFHLSQNKPNPFNPQTRIQFELPQSGTAQLAIYDVRGRRVRTLLAAELAAGRHWRDWDGTDDSGRRVASGVYLYRLSTRGHSSTHRMLLVQ